MSADPKHTPGPWRWEMNRASRTIELCGGGQRPGTYDWRVLTFRRWGTQQAQPEFWTWEGNLGNPELAKDLAEPVKGREHHADWFADINHPDARLIAAAPDQNAALIEADSFMAEVIEYLRDHHDVVDGDYGEPAPNRAMQLSTWADEVAAKIERALKKAEAANVG